MGRLHCFISLSFILGEEGKVFLIHLLPPSVLLCPASQHVVTFHVRLPLTWYIHAAGRVSITTLSSTLTTLSWVHLAHVILYFPSLTFQTFVIGNGVVSDIRLKLRSLESQALVESLVSFSTIEIVLGKCT